jgi:aspartyl protease
LDKKTKRALFYLLVELARRVRNLLVATGSTYNFLSAGLVQEARFTVNKLPKAMKIDLVQGSQYTEDAVLDLPAQAGECRARMNFLLLNMKGLDDILGLEWLHEHVVLLKNKGRCQVELNCGHGKTTHAYA